MRDGGMINWEYVMDAAGALASEGDMVRVETLTRSVLGREIPLITLGKGEKSVLYVGAHHGMEWITAGVLIDFARDLVSAYLAGRSVFEYRAEHLLTARKIYIVPMLNPDGVAYSQCGVEEHHPLRERLLRMNGEAGEDFSRWQANGRGVDLNHNYDAGFLEYKEKERQAGLLNGAPTRYSGEYPESEPETAALCALIRGRREELGGVLTLHTQGEEIYCSCADRMTAKCTAIGRLLQRYTGYRLASPTGLAAFGGLTDWCIAAQGLPAFTLECGLGENPLPASQRAVILERLRHALFAFPFWV